MTDISTEDLKGVFAVPPLPRKADARRSLDLDAAERVAAHIEAGGITRYLYGGNAFLYHITLEEFDVLLDWLDRFPSTRWAIPSLGPSFGRAIDQAPLVWRHAFRCAMMLPCGDPRDAAGMEAGLREIAAAIGVPLILYLKSEDGFGGNLDAGLDAVHGAPDKFIVIQGEEVTTRVAAKPVHVNGVAIATFVAPPSADTSTLATR